MLSCTFSFFGIGGCASFQFPFQVVGCKSIAGQSFAVIVPLLEWGTIGARMGLVSLMKVLDSIDVLFLFGFSFG